MPTKIQTNLTSLTSTEDIVANTVVTTSQSVQNPLRVLNSAICNLKPREILTNTFPVLQWLPRYNLKKDLLKDVISGLTVSSLQIPQGITYGNLLAGQSARYGLFTSFLPCLLYFLLGSSRTVSVGTYAIVCLLIGDFATQRYPDLPENSTTEAWEVLYSSRISDVTALNFYLAIFMVTCTAFT